MPSYFLAVEPGTCIQHCIISEAAHINGMKYPNIKTLNKHQPNMNTTVVITFSKVRKQEQDRDRRVQLRLFFCSVGPLSPVSFICVQYSLPRSLQLYRI